MTISAGVKGLIFDGSPPNLFTASLIAAKSVTAGTPLKKNIHYILYSIRQSLGFKCRTQIHNHAICRTFVD